MDLLHRCAIIVDMLQHVQQHYSIKTVIGQRAMDEVKL
jgi:hypothetical protein